MTNRLRPATLEEEQLEDQKWLAQSPLFWTSKAISTLIKIASIMYQWIPPPQEVGSGSGSQKRYAAPYTRPIRFSFDGYDPYEYD